MTKERLQTLRILIPGIMILILLVPLVQPQFNLLGAFGSAIVYGLVTFALGGAYHLANYLADVRGYLMRKALRRIDDNIKQRLLRPFAENEIIKASASRLSAGTVLLDVFYQLIDNDQSLKERAKDVYLNGLFLSTVADLEAIGVFFALIYLVASLVAASWAYFVDAVALAALAALARWVVMERVTDRHIQLGNQQLQFIVVHYRKDLQGKLEELAQMGDLDVVLP